MEAEDYLEDLIDDKEYGIDSDPFGQNYYAQRKYSPAAASLVKNINDDAAQQQNTNKMNRKQRSKMTGVTHGKKGKGKSYYDTNGTMTSYGVTGTAKHSSKGQSVGMQNPHGGLGQVDVVLETECTPIKDNPQFDLSLKMTMVDGREVTIPCKKRQAVKILLQTDSDPDLDVLDKFQKQLNAIK